jgi:hypothetical protein
MNKVACGITMSLDAFVAGPNQSFENPLGTSLTRSSMAGCLRKQKNTRLN